MTSCLYVGTLRHRRSRPTVHEFRYRAFLFYLDLDELPRLERRMAGFSVNGANLVSFHDRDHMDRRSGATKDKVVRFLRRHGTDLTGGRVSLLTGCRVLGYVFNPISLYYCHDVGGRLAAVVAEVHNTFGDRYLYVLDRPLTGDGAQSTRRYRTRKVMHVSPFVSMDAVYDFVLSPVGETLSVGIVEQEAGTHVLEARLEARRVPLTTPALARVLLTHPLMTLKTTAAIHFEALRLYLKRVPFHRRPPPSAAERTQNALLERLRDP